MDNITHSLAGWALGQAGLKTQSRKGLAALILGANMPDIDVFFGNAPWDPLAIHRGFTHGLVGGVLVMPPILAGLLWLLDRWQVSRGVTFKSGLPMQLRLAGRPRLPRRADPPVARPSDDLFGPAAVALLGLPGSTPTGCSSSMSGCGCCSPCDRGIEMARAEGARLAATAASRDRHHVRLHRDQPADQRASDGRRAQLGRRPSAPTPFSPRRRRSRSGGATSSGGRAIATAEAITTR